ncbi:MAG TPA: hypothetical protein V6D08_08280 [Candidatus Obscuribacterales bacterium]
MPKQGPSPQGAPPEPEQDSGGIRLEDLEQHISERINQLADSGSFESPFGSPEQPGPSSNSFVSAFEPFDVFDYPIHGDPESLQAAYREVSRSYQETAELLKGIHDLTDLVTESIRQLGIRLSMLEERLDGLSDERTDELEKLVREIKISLKESQKLLKEAGERSAASPAMVPDKSSAQIITELQKHVLALEERIDRNSADVKKALEERIGSVCDLVGSHFKVLEKEARDYLNRNLFSLAILVIVILFVAGALIVNTMDRMCTYLTQSMDSLRSHIDQMNIPLPPLPGGPPGRFPR